MYGYLSLGFLALSVILLVIEYSNKSIKKVIVDDFLTIDFVLNKLKDE
jgi:hypothetical protein